MKTSTALVFFISISLCLSAPSKALAANDGGKAAATAPIATPPAQMALLYPRIGTWQVTIQTLPGKSLPKGGMDNGVMTIRKGPGGFSIVQDFRSRGVSGSTIGQSYTWWDGNAKAYKSVWCDNMQGCTEFTTTINGNSWTTELEGEADGQKVHTTIHATMSADHNAIHEEVANSYNGAPAKTETISDYKRVAAGVAEGK